MEPVHSLPYNHADSTLRSLAGRAEGFGRLSIGGLHGHVYHVTTLADDGPGSLRDGCQSKEPLWIVFEVSGTINLQTCLSVSSYKTIDGRGQKIKLTGKGLRLKECEHVIICNLAFDGGRGPDATAIQIKPHSKHIWIDRCSLRDYDCGLIDITRESTDITVSRCHFSHHNMTMVIGADPSHIGDRCIRVTIHHCFFDGTQQRHPRVRFGKVHLYNNYTRNWGIYAVCVSVESQIYSQCNIYEAEQKKVAFKYLKEKATDKGEAENGYIKSERDLFVSGTEAGLMAESGEYCMFNPSDYYTAWTVEAPTDALKHVIQLNAGWQSIPLPIDQILTTDLRGLARQAEGFGHLAIGGLHGPLYQVTTLADKGPGSLRDGCRIKEPLWIVFEVSGTIHLQSYLSVSSYKTIDGRGQRILFTGKGLRLNECEHVIICNVEFERGKGPDADAIQIKPQSRHIWIDHCSLRDYDDGLIDITRGSTDVTVSWCHFSNHNKTILIGAHPSHVGDRCIRVTIHHCFFDGTRQRHPRVRFGKVHLYNNYTRNWAIYAVCASVESQIYSQCNIYEAAEKKIAFKYLNEKAADKDEAGSGYIRSEGDVFEAGTEAGLMSETDECCMFNPSDCYPAWTAEAPTDALKQALQNNTGWQCLPRPPDLLLTAQ
ncbi:probable pectate lyase C [Mercurialis annua]|uniref:probable pectate lyase C n=1 Tax=Mercurialis annua TaxID=3986 RepID=UPI00215FEBA7|nr:probable pectate lyase C [Mercurialis annua]